VLGGWAGAKGRRAGLERGEWRGGLIGAGPAGWLRESGSRLPQSKGLRPGCFGGARRRTPCAERAVILTAVQSLRLLVRRGLVGRGAGTEGERAHSVRPESCDGSQQSRACGALVRRVRVGRGAGSEGRPRALRAPREL
jgi:hypothetical protein